MNTGNSWPFTLAALLVLAALGWIVGLRRAPDLAGDLGGELAGAIPADDAWMPSYDPELDNAPDQLPTLSESALVTVQDGLASIPRTLGLTREPDAGQAAANEAAFLDMLAYAEGTAGPNGYRTLFGGGLFDSFADHPRQVFTFTNSRGETLRTSAAGRYQFLARTWDSLKAKLDLPDFGPNSQDSAALELIRERGALSDVRAGRLASAIAKVAPVWASLPGAGYAQPERKVSQLSASFQGAGGTLEA